MEIEQIIHNITRNLSSYKMVVGSPSSLFSIIKQKHYYNDNCYLGYKFIRGDVWYNNQLKCIDLNNETVVTIKITVSGSNKELTGINVQSDKSFGGANVDYQPPSPNIGNLNYNSTNGFLEIYLGEDKGWVGIESYSLSHSIAAVEE